MARPKEQPHWTFLNGPGTQHHSVCLTPFCDTSLTQRSNIGIVFHCHQLSLLVQAGREEVVSKKR